MLFFCTNVWVFNLELKHLFSWTTNYCTCLCKHVQQLCKVFYYRDPSQIAAMLTSLLTAFIRPEHGETQQAKPTILITIEHRRSCECLRYTIFDFRIWIRLVMRVVLFTKLMMQLSCWGTHRPVLLMQWLDWESWIFALAVLQHAIQILIVESVEGLGGVISKSKFTYIACCAFAGNGWAGEDTLGGRSTTSKRRTGRFWAESEGHKEEKTASSPCGREQANFFSEISNIYCSSYICGFCSSICVLVNK